MHRGAHAVFRWRQISNSSALLAGRVNGGWVEHCNTIRQSHLSHGIITQMTSNTMQLKQRVPSKNMGEDGLNLVWH